MRTELNDGEEVALVKHNNPNAFWTSFTYTPTACKIQGDWVHGSFYLTNQRIIFEGKNSNNRIIYLENIESFTYSKDCFFLDIVSVLEEKSAADVIINNNGRLK